LAIEPRAEETARPPKSKINLPLALAAPYFLRRLRLFSADYSGGLSVRRRPLC
jgi:hypothetical protein